MMKSTGAVASSLTALAMTCAMAAIHPQPAAAQTATNLRCDGCVNSRDIRNGSIRAQDLAPAVRSGLFGETIFVRSNGANAAANCNKLRNALAQIDDASATNPVLVKLERGTYDCRATPLAMKRFVTIEGAGRNLSRIIGNVDGVSEGGIVNGAHDAALRHLTVEHRANGAIAAIAINTRGRRMSLSDVAIKVDSTTASAVYGIFADGGVLDLAKVSIQTSNARDPGWGIAAFGAKLDMTNVSVHSVVADDSDSFALDLTSSSATGSGVLFSSNRDGLRGFDSVVELVDGTVIGDVVDATNSRSFTCVGIADERFTARDPDCS